MFTEVQFKRLLSQNESLQIQLDEVNSVLAARDKQIESLQKQLAEAKELRSKIDGQQEEIENFHYLLYTKEKQASGELKRETGLRQDDLDELAILKNKYKQLLQQYTNLTSRFTEAEEQITILTAEHFDLEKTAAKIGQLQSIIENSRLEREALKKKLLAQVPQQYLKEINL